MVDFGGEWWRITECLAARAGEKKSVGASCDHPPTGTSHCARFASVSSTNFPLDSAEGAVAEQAPARTLVDRVRE
jgi:hypothetical protein